MTKQKIKQWERFFEVLERTRIRVETMNTQIKELINKIINELNESKINALYEVIIKRDYDYIENLFPTKEDFKEFIEKYKEDQND